MDQIVLITNLSIDEKTRDNKNIVIINFNPWGFSKIGLQKQITEALVGNSIPSNVKVKYYINDLFFGRRSEIAFQKLKELLPNNEVVRIGIETLNSLLNNSSV